MGTCMSKDKKGPTSAAHTASASSSSSSSSSQDKQIQNPRKNSDSTIVRSSNAEENFPITIARPSSEDEGKEPTSTDKHVVEIRLPIASPSKFKVSPASATLAARAMPVIARPAVKERDSTQNREEEEEEEAEAEGAGEGGAYCDREGPSSLRKSSLPLFYSSYLSRASFSRDLAAFSRDIASLSSSPLTRSPSVNGAHDVIAAAIKAAHSPLCAQAKPHSNMVHDDYLTTTRSRSLPKRFYGKDSSSNLPPLHKRSTSRDAGMEHRKSLKRRPFVDPPCELTPSPRLSVRREEASGEYRVCARQAAARKAHHKQNAQLVPSKTLDMELSGKKDRSPLRRSATGKVADADQADHNCSQFQKNQNFIQTIHNGSTILNYSRGRPALVERSTNCSSWADATNLGVRGSFKDFNKLAIANVNQNYENARGGRSITKNELFEEGCQVEATQPECPNSSVYCSSKPRVSASDESDTTGVSMDRVRSLIESLTDLNLGTSLFSEVEESETEVEGELDLLQFAFHDEFSPGQELQAQQTRNMLLKEAAMDAFARPNFHSSTNSEELEEGKVPPNSDLAALMSLRLTEAEVDTLKIRKVLKLLSIAGLEMGKEQKMLFYNQLRMVLDSVKPQDDNSSQTGTSVAGNMKEKAVNARANSWPRSMKEPSPIVISAERSSNQVSSKTPNQKLSLKAMNGAAVLPSIAQLQEELSLGDQESLFQALGPCELDDLQVSVQKTGGDLEYAHPEKLSYNVCHAHQANEHTVHQVDESLNVDLSSAQHEFPVEEEELMREGYCGAEVLSKSASQVLDAIDDLLTKDFHNKRGAGDNACTSSNLNSMVDGTLVMTGVLHQPQSTPFEACAAVEAGDTCTTPPAPPSHSDTCVPPVERRLQCDKDASGNSRSEDVASDGSFEFRVRSSGASTPSTPIISTASTPRHLSPFTAQAIAEIWEAFE